MENTKPFFIAQLPDDFKFDLDTLERLRTQGFDTVSVRKNQDLDLYDGRRLKESDLDEAFILYGLGVRSFLISIEHISNDDTEAPIVKKVKAAWALLGNGVKATQECEKENIKPLRRSIAAKGHLKKGRVITLEDLIWIRPGTGIPPGQEKRVIGKILLKDLSAGELMEDSLLSGDK